MRVLPVLSQYWQGWKLRHRLVQARSELRRRLAYGSSWPSSPHGLNRRLVVSLTSYPKRFETLALALQRLLFQSLRPDEIILWLARGERAALPIEVLELEQFGLVIRETDDIRSFKKIIPTLELCPDAVVVTADDDIYYWPTWLEELVAVHSQTGDAVVCHRAHRITLSPEGLPRRYDDWNKKLKPEDRSALLFPLGVLGVLYDTRIFHPDVTRRDLFEQLCPNADDVWLYWMHRMNGSVPHLLGRRARIVEWPGTQTGALKAQNVGAGRNDLAIAAMIARYGFPPPLNP